MRVELCLFFEGQFVCNRLCKDFGKCYGFWSGIHEQGFVCHTLLHKVLTTISDTFVASCHTVAAALCTPLFAWGFSALSLTASVFPLLHLIWNQPILETNHL